MRAPFSDILPIRLGACPILMRGVRCNRGVAADDGSGLGRRIVAGCRRAEPAAGACCRGSPAASFLASFRLGPGSAPRLLAFPSAAVVEICHAITEPGQHDGKDGCCDYRSSFFKVSSFNSVTARDGSFLPAARSSRTSAWRDRPIMGPKSRCSAALRRTST